jgi:hypothetical protein
MKKNYFLVVDTETTQDEKVADFGAVICDKKGEIFAQCGVMVDGIFGEVSHPLFFDSKLPSDALWSKSGADARYRKYTKMLDNGSRMLASTSAINRWLARANAQYNPILTAYNLSFDVGKCRNTGIDLAMFNRRFCLMAVAQNLLINSRKYLEFALQHHCFNPKTVKTGSMTMQMKAETVASYLHGEYIIEPHTALEDVTDFEIDILKFVCRKKSIKSLVNDRSKAISYTQRQLKNLFKPA